MAGQGDDVLNRVPPAEEIDGAVWQFLRLLGVEPDERATNIAGESLAYGVAVELAALRRDAFQIDEVAFRLSRHLQSCELLIPQRLVEAALRPEVQLAGRLVAARIAEVTSSAGAALEKLETHSGRDGSRGFGVQLPRAGPSSPKGAATRRANRGADLVTHGGDAT